MVSGLTIPFDNVYDEDEYNDLLEEMDEELAFEIWYCKETIEDFFYSFDDNLTVMLQTDEPLINDLIRNYIWNDICKRNYKLLKMFKMMYEETEDISFTFYKSNHSIGRFNNIGFFELWNDITDEFNYFIIKDTGISTSSQMSIWIEELYEEFQKQQDERGG